MEFVLNHLQRPLLRMLPRKKDEIGRERPHFFADDPPKSFVGSLPPSQLMRIDVLRGRMCRSKDLSERMSDIL
jgi:hypothetical protein